MRMKILGEWYVKIEMFRWMMEKRMDMLGEVETLGMWMNAGGKEGDGWRCLLAMEMLHGVLCKCVDAGH